VPDHAHDVARQRLVEELGQLDPFSLSHRRRVRRRFEHILSGCRDSCVSEKVTGAHRATVSITGLVGE
jgi:hypothetical protein